MSVSPAFQLPTNIPVRDSSNDTTPLENPTAIKVSAGFVHMTFMVPAKVTTVNMTSDYITIPDHICIHVPTNAAELLQVCRRQ